MKNRKLNSKLAQKNIKKFQLIQRAKNQNIKKNKEKIQNRDQNYIRNQN